MDPISDASAWVLPVVLAITLHEAAHGWMAERFGDDTARMSGRVTFNPLKHVDRVGTILLPGLLFLAHAPFLFGYAKPVPVNFYRLKPPRLGMFMVALAGPGTNLLLAIASAMLMHMERLITAEQQSWLLLSLNRSVVINCVLAVFNMIPIVPLDGGRVVFSLLDSQSQRLFSRLERYGIWLVMTALLVLPMFGVTVVQEMVLQPINWLIEHVFYLTGLGNADTTIQ